MAREVDTGIERYRAHPVRCVIRLDAEDLTIADALARGLLVRVSEGIYRRTA